MQIKRQLAPTAIIAIVVAMLDVIVISELFVFSIFQPVLQPD
ncbi:MAG: hypothetical protein ACREBS_09595 [Nitrososphaerales archaeon]